MPVDGAILVILAFGHWHWERKPHWQLVKIRTVIRAAVRPRCPLRLIRVRQHRDIDYRPRLLQALTDFARP